MCPFCCVSFLLLLLVVFVFFGWCLCFWFYFVIPFSLLTSVFFFFFFFFFCPVLLLLFCVACFFFLFFVLSFVFLFLCFFLWLATIFFFCFLFSFVFILYLVSFFVALCSCLLFPLSHVLSFFSPSPHVRLKRNTNEKNNYLILFACRGSFRKCPLRKIIVSFFFCWVSCCSQNMYWLDIVGLCLEGVRDSWLLVLSCSIVVLVLVAPYCAIPRDYLSDTPLLRAMGFLVSQHGQLGAIPPPPFLSVFPLGEHAKWRCDTPPQKGYLSDTCAIPYENKANVCDTPLCDTISKGYCAIWGGISHWAAKVLVFGDEPSFCPNFPWFLAFLGFVLFCVCGFVSILLRQHLLLEWTRASIWQSDAIGHRVCWSTCCASHFWSSRLGRPLLLGGCCCRCTCSRLCRDYRMLLLPCSNFLTSHFPAYCSARVSLNITIHIQRLSNPQWWPKPTHHFT